VESVNSKSASNIRMEWIQERNKTSKEKEKNISSLHLNKFGPYEFQ
jgi:hypothetical protein